MKKGNILFKITIINIAFIFLLNNIGWATTDTLRPLVGSIETYKQIKEEEEKRSRLFWENSLYGYIDKENQELAKTEFGKRIEAIAEAFRRVSLQDKDYGYGWMQNMRTAARKSFKGTIAKDINAYLPLPDGKEKGIKKQKIEHDLEHFRKAVYSMHFVVELRKAMEIRGQRIAIHLNNDEMYEIFFDIIQWWIKIFSIQRLKNSKERAHIITRTNLFLNELTNVVYDTGKIGYWYRTKAAKFRSRGRDVLIRALRICIDENFRRMEDSENIDRFFDRIISHHFMKDVIGRADVRPEVEEPGELGASEVGTAQPYIPVRPSVSETRSSYREVRYSMPSSMGPRVIQSVEVRQELRQQLLLALRQSQTTALLVDLELNIEELIRQRGFMDEDTLYSLIEVVKERVKTEFKKIKSKTDLKDGEEEKQVDEIIESMLRSIEAGSWAFARKYIRIATDLEDRRAQMLYDIEVNHRVITEGGNTYFEARDRAQRFITQDTMYLMSQFSLAAILRALNSGTAGTEILPAMIVKLAGEIPASEISKIMEDDRDHFLRAAKELHKLFIAEPEKYPLWMKSTYGAHYGTELMKLIEMAEGLRDWPQDFDEQKYRYISLYCKVLEFTKQVFDPEQYKLLRDMDEPSLGDLYKNLKNVRVVNDVMIIGNPEELSDENSVHKALIIGIPPKGSLLSGGSYNGARINYILVLDGLTHELMLQEGIQCYAVECGIGLNGAFLRDSIERVTYANVYLYDMGSEECAVVYKFHNIFSSLNEFVIYALKQVGFKDTRVEIKSLEEKKALVTIKTPEESRDLATAERLNLEESFIGKLFDLAEKGFKLNQMQLVKYAREQLNGYREAARIYIKGRLPLFLEGIAISDSEGDFDVGGYVQFLQDFGGSELVRELREILKDSFTPVARKADAVCALGRLTNKSERVIPDILALQGSTQSIHLACTSWEALDRIASSEDILEIAQRFMTDIKKRFLEGNFKQYEGVIDARIQVLDSIFTEIETFSNRPYTAISRAEIVSIAVRLAEVAQVPILHEKEGNSEEYDIAIRLFGDIARISYLLMNHLKVVAVWKFGPDIGTYIRKRILLAPIYTKIRAAEAAINSENNLEENIKPALYQLLFLATESLITIQELKTGLMELAGNVKRLYGGDEIPNLIKLYYEGDLFPLTEDERNWFNIILIEALGGEVIIRNKDVEVEKERNRAEKPEIEKVKVVTICPKLFLGFSANLSELPGDVQPLIEAGGGGSDVAKVLKNTETPFMLLGFKGGVTGRMVANLLERQGISTADLIESYESGVAKVAIRTGKEQITLKPETHAISKTERRRLLNKIDDVIERIAKMKDKGFGYNPVFVLTGGLPAGIGDDFYAVVVDKCKEKGIRVIVDTTKKALLETIKAAPFLIKPNEEEFKDMVVGLASDKAHTGLASLLDRYYDKEKEGWTKKLEYGDYAELAAEARMTTGVENILITMGEEGAVWVGEDRMCHIPAPSIKKVTSTIAAGDTVVAVIAKRISEGATLKEAIGDGIYAGTLTVQVEGSGVVKNWEAIEHLLNEQTLKIVDLRTVAEDAGAYIENPALLRSSQLFRAAL